MTGNLRKGIPMSNERLKKYSILLVILKKSKWNKILFYVYKIGKN